MPDAPGERWAPVPGRAGYEVSDFGRVRFNSEIQRQAGRDYLSVPDRLTRRRRLLAHVLVLEAFHGLRPEGMQARHLNGDSFDNRPVNFKWGTAKENATDRIEHERQREAGLLAPSRLAGKATISLRPAFLAEIDAFGEVDHRTRTNTVEFLVHCALNGRDPFHCTLGRTDKRIRYEAALEALSTPESEAS